MPTSLTSIRILLFASALGTALALSPAFAKPPNVAEKYSARYIHENLIAGKTTPSETRERFGEPHSSSRYSTGNDEYVRWNYFREKENSVRRLLSSASSKLAVATDLLRGTGADKLSEQTIKANQHLSRGQDKLDSAELLIGKDSSAIESISVVFKNGVVNSISSH